MNIQWFQKKQAWASQHPYSKFHQKRCSFCFGFQADAVLLMLFFGWTVGEIFNAIYANDATVFQLCQEILRWFKNENLQLSFHGFIWVGFFWDWQYKEYTSFLCMQAWKVDETMKVLAVKLERNPRYRREIQKLDHHLLYFPSLLAVNFVMLGSTRSLPNDSIRYFVEAKLEYMIMLFEHCLETFNSYFTVIFFIKISTKDVPTIT